MPYPKGKPWSVSARLSREALYLDGKGRKINRNPLPVTNFCTCVNPLVDDGECIMCGREIDKG